MSRAQGLQHGDEAVVAQLFELAHAAPFGLLVGLRHDRVEQLVGQLGHVRQLRPRPLQGGPELDERWDLGELERQVLESQRARHLVARALATGAYAPWDFQPYSDASLLYVRSDAARGDRPGRTRPPGGLPPAHGP